MTILFRAYFRQKNFQLKFSRNFFYFDRHMFFSLHILHYFFTILFRAYFRQKNFQLKFSRNFFYLGQDPDPDVFESWIQIRSKIVRIRNIATKKEDERLL
jgi:hypothetical protein